MFLKTIKSFLICYIKVLLVRLACLVRFQARVRLLDHAWYFRLLSHLCWCPVRPNFGRTQARHLPGSPTQSKTFFCQVHVWLMFDSKNGIPARVRLDSVSVWFKDFVRGVPHFHAGGIDLFKTRPIRPGVYSNPAFIWDPAFIYWMHISAIHFLISVPEVYWTKN